jgi:XRE family transcriptional regulator, regulator of sulfur utilization
VQQTNASAVRRGRPKGSISFDAPVAIAFGQALRDVRVDKELTQEQLGLIAGVAPTFVGQIERGENQASLSIILKLARALGVSGASLVASAESLVVL